MNLPDYNFTCRPISSPVKSDWQWLKFFRYGAAALLAAAIAACSEGPTSRLEKYEIHGIDVSHYQKDIDWDTVAGQGIDFAFVKATEGLTFHDHRYRFNWEEMKRVGIKRGAYHFFRPTLDPVVQANNFIEITDFDPGDLPPVLDVEVLDNVSKSELIDGVRQWLSLVELKLGARPILYTNVKFYNKYLSGEFEHHPLWIARYSQHEPKLLNRKAWTFWQYGSRGKIHGIKGEVDFNVFHADSMALEELSLSPQTVLSVLPSFPLSHPPCFAR